MTELSARLATLLLLEQVVDKQKNLDDVFAREVKDLSDRDKRFVKYLMAVLLKRLGQIDGVIGHLLKNPLPLRARKAQHILRIGVAQLLWMDVPEHAAVSTSVELAKQTGQNFYAQLINAVLRNLCRQKPSLPPDSVNFPEWMLSAWEKGYGKKQAQDIVQALLQTPPTMITVKENPQLWAQKLNGKALPGGSVILPEHADIPLLEGYQEGMWWVQNESASLPVKILGDIKGLTIADLCAAPGGKTAQLATLGAHVDAYDISPKRIEKLKENLARLHLSANVFCADINKLEPTHTYDAVVLDAPCSATGTLAHHPDVLYHRTPKDIEKLTAVQDSLLKKAWQMVKTGGRVVYCTCSLQPQEGEERIAQMLDLYCIIPLQNQPHATKNGFLRIYPNGYNDGFFIALLEKK